MSVQIGEYRSKIDEIDGQIVGLLEKRAEYAVEIAKLKKGHGLPVPDAAREATVLDSVTELANDMCGHLDGESVRNIFRMIIEETRTAEEQ